MNCLLNAFCIHVGRRRGLDALDSAAKAVRAGRYGNHPRSLEVECNLQDDREEGLYKVERRVYEKVVDINASHSST